jgi:KUP system potassium uptake protein
MSGFDTKKLSAAGVLITIGIVFGDIGTSPLYVFEAITKHNYNPDLVLGGLSSVIWTLILLATTKYIYLALNADNNGEGGIFALYALLKEKKLKWIIIPTLIGCATLLADGFITPAISISSAVEGLKTVDWINQHYPNLPTIPIVSGIVIALFLIQQFGTASIGKIFGPVMIVWFGLLAYLGLKQIMINPSVLAAFNPYYIYNMIAHVDGGFWVLGAVFLCTTGAEALYSDLGHCGKKNIRASWAAMSVILVINYLGQASLCLSDGFHLAPKQTVFWAMVPENLRIFSIVIATLATVIASQALITGVFTLMNEAIKLKLWTNLKVKYPTDHRGQIYIPFINWFLMGGCLLVIYIFKNATAMEATYGLSITIDMVMTSVLLCILLILKKPKLKAIYIGIFTVFLLIEGCFLLSNLGKIAEGAWFTLILSATFFVLLYLYYKARLLRKNITEYVPMNRVIPLLNSVRSDLKIDFEATNLVYPTRSDSPQKLDSSVFYSLFKKRPRKAQVTWFLHLNITNEPWGVHYSVNEIIDKHCYYISLNFGFKEEHRVEFMMKKIHDKMVEKGELTGESVFDCLKGKILESDFKFVMLNSRVATDNFLTPFQIIIVKVYRFIKMTGLSPAEDFGLDKTNVAVEYVPISVTKQFDLEMIEDSEDYSKKLDKKLDRSKGDFTQNN